MTETVAPVLLDVADSVATITLNRPDRLNAMTPGLVGALVSALEDVAVEPTVRVVVLTGAGRGFCAGGDLEAGLSAMVGPPPLTRQASGMRAKVRVVQLLHDLPQVTVAALNGAAAGAGLSLALACDLRVASERAKLGTAFLNAGVSGDFGGIWFATRMLGGARARELFLLPEVITAAEAARLGLVNRVFPDDTYSGELAALVRTLAARAPLALTALKENLRDAEHLDLAAYLDVETVRMVGTVATDDAAEATDAFLAKRTPRFLGR